MTKYIALIRGITPSNPDMHNEKLRAVFEGLGYKNVQTVISSGNVIFETRLENVNELESTIEKALQEKLNFKRTTIVFSKEDTHSFISEDPFKNQEDGPQCKLNVTFLKNTPDTEIKLPYHGKNKVFTVLGVHGRVITSMVDLSKGRTPELMRWMDNEFGNELTTRTWKTVQKIMKRFDNSK